MNNKVVWLAKHWGLGTGALMSISGLIMAAPGNMTTWNITQGSDKDPFLGTSYTTTAITRINETIPNKYKLIGTIQDNHELKGLGTSMMILGTILCTHHIWDKYMDLSSPNSTTNAPYADFRLCLVDLYQG